VKFGLLVVLVVLLCAIGANFLLQDPGSVVITFRGKIIEMSVIVLGVLVALLFGALWVAGKLLDAPRKLGEAAGRYRAGRAGARLTRGVIEVAEGNFAKGERMLARSAGASEAPLLNYLQAARAAHLLGEDERRDTWLKQAYENLPGAANAVLLTQAELQLDQKQYEQALATLRRIEESSPNHTRALALLGRIYYRLGDWQQLAELLPKIRRHGRVDAATLEEWSVRVHREKQDSARDPAALEEAWQNVPKELRHNIDLVEARVTNLVRIGMHERAEKELVAELKRDWRGPLVRLFGQVTGSDPVKQLRHAEDWLSGHPEDPDLLLAAARLCLRNELWGKARSYLETVIAMRPSPEAYAEYGRLLQQLGEDEAAAEAFRDGLGLVSGTGLPAIPHLGADAGASA